MIEKSEMRRAQPSSAAAAMEAGGGVTFIHATASWVGFYGLLVLCDRLFG